MHTSRLSSIRYLSAGLVLGTAVWALPAQAQDAQQRYQQELQQCAALQGEALKACQRDAGAALQAERQNKLGQGDQNLQSNRNARCQALPAERQQECMLPMQESQNTVISGSVQGGGILRETTTTVPASSQ